jgi:hypothetical protein
MEDLFVNSKISDLLECINGTDTNGDDFKIKNSNLKVKDEFNKFARIGFKEIFNIMAKYGIKIDYEA